MRLQNWHPELASEEMTHKAMDRLEKAAEPIRDKARLMCRTGEARPPYKGGKPWTARVPGTLAKSVRVVRLKGDPNLDVRIYAGARKADMLTAYYAHMVEYGTVKMSARPFLRPAMNMSKGQIKRIMEHG